MDLKATLDADDPHLLASGEIYRAPVQPQQPPIVSDVVASDGRVSWFSLPAGNYEYRFHVGAGAGKFKISILKSDESLTLASDDFDTQYGYTGKVLAFSVQQ